MKIFQKVEPSWDAKVNFVDINNVFVGYDMEQSCCEHAGWFIKDSIAIYNYDEEYDNENTPDIESYNFDPNFFKHVDSEWLDEGGMVAFRLVSVDKPDLFLHLFNAHNGYYHHGFEFKNGDKVIESDSL